MDSTAIVAIASAGGAVLGALVVQIGAFKLDGQRREDDRKSRAMENQHSMLNELLDLSSQNYQQLKAMGTGRLASLISIEDSGDFQQVIKRSMRALALAHATGDDQVLVKTVACLEPIDSYLKSAAAGEFSDESERDVLNPDAERYQRLWEVLGDKLRES